MIKKIYLYFLAASLTLSVVAGANEKILKKNDPAEIRTVMKVLTELFALNKGLDNVIFEPVAKAYRVLPNPVRSGVSNSLQNLVSVVTIRNNIFKVNLKKQGEHWKICDQYNTRSFGFY